MSTTTQIFEFAGHFIENIHVQPNGRLLLTSLNSGFIFTLDPNSAAPIAKKAVDCPGSTGLSGIATVGPNRYAVSGGIHGSFRFDNMSVYVVEIDEDGEGVLLDRIRICDTIGLNGMASIPVAPHIVLSADSHGGCIYRINTQTREVDIPISDELLGAGPTFKLGINGIKIYGEYIYFTNSGQGTFCRVKIDNDGNKTGEIEIIARLKGEPAGLGHAYDDFTFDDGGNAYIATHLNELVKITKDGVQSTFAGGGNDKNTFRAPTSAATARDGKSIYVATGGMVPGETESGWVFNGQIIKVAL